VNKDIAPATPSAKRLGVIVWLVAAIAGTASIWWLTSSLNELTELARTDRAAAVALFKSRVLPAFILTVLVGVAGGVLLMRQGIQVLRAGEFPPPGMFALHDTPRKTGSGARTIGWLLASTGFLLAAIPLVILGVILWMLQRLH
jgi:hypothetical protein